jgi:hypothetical protein
MAAIHRKWRDIAFYHDIEKKDKIEGILIITDEDERVITQQLTVKKYLPDGNHNPDWAEIMEQVGDERITANTVERKEKKAQEVEKNKRDELSKRKVKELEQLFEMKVRTLEIDEIKNSKNTQLKSKLRRSKNVVEMNTIATLIMMEEMGVKFVIEEKDGD